MSDKTEITVTVTQLDDRCGFISVAVDAEDHYHEVYNNNFRTVDTQFQNDMESMLMNCIGRDVVPGKSAVVYINWERSDSSFLKGEHEKMSDEGNGVDPIEPLED